MTDLNIIEIGPRKLFNREGQIYNEKCVTLELQHQVSDMVARTKKPVLRLGKEQEMSQKDYANEQVARLVEFYKDWYNNNIEAPIRELARFYWQ